MKRSMLMVFMLSILAAVLLVGCGGASADIESAEAAAPKPNKVQIKELTSSPMKYNEVNKADFVQKLHKEMKALPVFNPAVTLCIQQAGPRYSLTFLIGNKVFQNATADKSGCGTVTIGTKDMRLANTTFWSMIDQALAKPKKADKLTIKTTNVTENTTTKVVKKQLIILGLQTSIQGLKPMPADTICTEQLGPRYDLNFQTGDVSLWKIVADKSGCGTVTLPGGDVRLADSGFWQLLDAGLRS